MEVLKRVLEMLQRQERGILVTVLDADQGWYEFIGEHWVWHEDCGWNAFSAKALASESPLEPRQTVLQLEGEMMARLDGVCRETLQQGQFRRERVEGGYKWLELMIEPIIPIPRLVILGCGHVGQALAKLADITDWPITVVDDRPDYANESLFPSGTTVYCGDFRETIQRLNLVRTDFVVIVTRGHQYDRICLEALNGRELAYLGMIGSRRRVRGLMDELVKSGFGKGWLATVHSPIGLEIGAETPEEIAVSIVAEMIQVRRKGVL